MAAILDVKVQVNDTNIPSDDDFQLWINTALVSTEEDMEINIVVMDSASIQELNTSYRHQAKPTNVLSFPFESPPDLNLPILGDIALCHDVIVQESIQQRKSLKAHYAHLTIHGCLHLQGYDHINNKDAERMESLEIKLMKQLEYPNPYEDTEQVEHVRER